MPAIGTYFTTGAPANSLGYMIQAESRVRIGTEQLYGSLEVSSWTYETYEASIGLQNGKSVDLGQVESVGFSHVPTFEPLESANVRQPSIYVLTGEETTVTVGVRQFDPRVLDVAIGTSVMYKLGQEYLITFGDQCTLKSRPIEIGVTNIGCDKPGSPDVDLGISAIVLTIYDCQCTSGLPWDAIVANEVNVLELEFMAKPVLERQLGNRLGNLYIF